MLCGHSSCVSGELPLLWTFAYCAVALSLALTLTAYESDSVHYFYESEARLTIARAEMSIKLRAGDLSFDLGAKMDHW